VYRIGQFSKIGKVTVKALRHYEEEGMLAPAWVDPASSYRYYESWQLPHLHRIVALRQCGVPIAEIRAITDGADPGTVLAERRIALEQEAREAARRLASLTAAMRTMEAGGLAHQVVVKALPGALVFHSRFIAESYDAYVDLVPALGAELAAANPGLHCPEDGYCFIEYHDGEYRDHDIDIEYCQQVSWRGASTERIGFKQLEPVAEAACVLHQGPYRDLRAAYAAAFRWIDEHGLQAGNPRESYIDGIWNTEDEADWLTEVQVPLRRVPEPGR
jgi:DNA-binding transcriptional MerR regulator